MLTMDIDEGLRTRLAVTPILSRDAAGALTGTASKDVTSWMSGASPAVQRPKRRGWSPYSVGFVGLLEVDLMHRLQLHGVPRRRAGNALRNARAHLGELAVYEQPEFVTDGTDLFRRHRDGLTRLRDLQEAFDTVLEGFLSRVVLDDKGRAVEYSPERLSILSVNPLFNGGALSHTMSRVPVSSIAGSLAAGDPPSAVSRNYHVPLEDVEQIDEQRDWAFLASE